MTHVKEKIYKKIGDFDFFEFVGVSDLDLRWGVEAGCHNGADTLRFLSFSNIENIFAFEPDAVARKEAELKLASYLGNRVSLFPYALMDSNQEIILDFFENEAGTGNTQVVATLSFDAHGGKSIPARALDSMNLDYSGNGFLWLDVEGQALNVLRGAEKILQSIVIAKIEVEMHDMWGIRKQNAEAVIKSMSKSGFKAVKLPIHPGYFGDILFVKASYLSPFARFNSSFKCGLFIALHKFIFPILKKPS